MGILQINMTAALLILVILIFRIFAVNRLPKTIFPILWCVVLLRLWLPFFISLPAGSSLTALAGFAQASQAIQDTVRTSLPVFKQVQTSSIHPWIWMAVWISGTVVLLAVFLVLYLLHLRNLADAIPIKRNPFLNEWLDAQHLRRQVRFYHSDRIKTPATLGVFHPRILLPAQMDLSDTTTLTYILYHELVHIRRLDVLWKIWIYLTICVYWFNPAVWVLLYFADRDLEISCDETVLKKMGRQVRAPYASALVHMAETGGKMEPATQGFSRNALEERVYAVMYFKKASAWVVTLGFVLVASSATVFAVAPKALDFPVSLIPRFSNPGAILTVGADGKLYVENAGLTTDSSRILLSSSQQSDMPTSSLDSGSSDTSAVGNVSGFSSNSTRSQSVPASNQPSSSDSGNVVQGSESSTAGTHMPNREPGMRFVYDGAHNLTKITNADGYLYYFPTDGDTPKQYQNSTWFIVDGVVTSDGQDVPFNIDTADGMRNAQAWIIKHLSVKRQQETLHSLQIQKGTKILVYYEGKIVS